MVVKKPDTEENNTSDPWANFEKPAENVADRDFMTVTLKGGGQDSWIVFHFNSVDEALDTLDPENGNIGQLMEFAAQTEASFVRHVRAAKGTGSPSQASSGGGWGNRSNNRQQAPQSGSESCQHGELQFKSGSKNGKPWKGMFCPAGVCPPQWS